MQCHSSQLILSTSLAFADCLPAVVEDTRIRLMPTTCKLPCYETSPLTVFGLLSWDSSFIYLHIFEIEGCNFKACIKNTMTRILIMSSHPPLVLASNIFPVGLTPNFFYVYLIFRMRATCPRLVPYRNLLPISWIIKYCCVWLEAYIVCFSVS